MTALRPLYVDHGAAAGAARRAGADRRPARVRRGPVSAPPALPRGCPRPGAVVDGGALRLPRGQRPDHLSVARRRGRRALPGAGPAGGIRWRCCSTACSPSRAGPRSISAGARRRSAGRSSRRLAAWNCRSTPTCGRRRCARWRHRICRAATRRARARRCAVSTDIYAAHLAELFARAGVPLEYRGGRGSPLDLRPASRSALRWYLWLPLIRWLELGSAIPWRAARGGAPPRCRAI